MRDGVGLVADQVVESVCAVGVDEAVANPLTSSNAVLKILVIRRAHVQSEEARQYLRLVDIGDDFKGRLNAVLLNLA